MTPNGAPTREEEQRMGRYADRPHGRGTVYFDDQRQRWRGQVKVKGRRYNVSGRKRGEVEKRLDAILLGDIEAESGAAGEDGGTTLGAWLARWVEDSDGSEGTIANRRWAVAHLASLHARALSTDPDESVTALEVQDLLKAKRADLGRSSLVRIRTVLAMALDEALKHHLVSENVARIAKIPKGARRTAERRALTREEADRLLAAAGLDGDGIVVILGYYLGLRPGEVCGLQWADVNLDAGTLTVAQMRRREPDGSLTFCATKGDGSSDRTFVNLRPEVAEALARHKAAQATERLRCRTWQDYGLVVTTRYGTPIDPSNHRRALTRIAEAAGIFDGLTPNELRHTFATHFVARGNSLTDLSVAMGHKNERMGMLHYNHPGRIVDMGLGA